MHSYFLCNLIISDLIATVFRFTYSFLFFETIQEKKMKKFTILSLHNKDCRNSPSTYNKINETYFHYVPYTWGQRGRHHPKNRAIFYAIVGPSPLPLIHPIIFSSFFYSQSSLHKQ